MPRGLEGLGAGGNEAELVEPERFRGRGGHDQVPVMDRIERAAEEPDQAHEDGAEAAAGAGTPAHAFIASALAEWYFRR